MAPTSGAVSATLGNCIQVGDLSDESLVWLLPFIKGPEGRNHVLQALARSTRKDVSGWLI